MIPTQNFIILRGQLSSTLSATKQQQEKKAARVATRLAEKLLQALAKGTVDTKSLLGWIIEHS